MTIIQLVIGGIVLTLGRQLYWFFVGAAGFVLGIELANRFFSTQPILFVIVVALVLGVLGSLLAIFLQSLAIGAAGFIIGGFTLNTLLDIFNVNLSQGDVLIFLIGGVVGALLVLALFDWALILLSSLAGSILIVRSLSFAPLTSAVLILALFIIGLALQVTQLQGGSVRQEG